MINSVNLVGRLTASPELKYTPSGSAVTSFTLAVDRPFKKENGEKETDFITCVAWKKTAESAANFLSKGSLAGVEGSIQTRSYENKEGKKVYVTEVLVKRIVFLDSKPKQEKNSQPSKQNKPFDWEQLADDGLPF